MHVTLSGPAGPLALEGDGLVEPAQAVEQLVARGLDADLDGVVVPMSPAARLRLAPGHAADLAGRAAPRLDATEDGCRQEDVGGEEELTSRIDDRLGVQGGDGHGADRAQGRLPLGLVAPDPDGLWEEDRPQRLRSDRLVGRTFRRDIERVFGLGRTAMRSAVAVSRAARPRSIAPMRSISSRTRPTPRR